MIAGPAAQEEGVRGYCEYPMGSVMTSGTNVVVERLIETINNYGWAIQGVFARADDSDPEDFCSFMYTVGLHKCHHPELITFGVPPGAGGYMLNRIGEMISNGASFRHGDVSDQILDGGEPMAFIDAPDPSEYVTMAEHLYGPKVRALQVFFRDQDGLWPWQAGSALSKIPVLGSVPAALQ